MEVLIVILNVIIIILLWFILDFLSNIIKGMQIIVDLLVGIKNKNEK